MKVRAESSVNMMATACLLVSLGSRVTHLTVADLSVTWHGIHRGLSQGEAPPLHPPQLCHPQEGPLGPQDSEQIITAYRLGS